MALRAAFLLLCLFSLSAAKCESGDDTCLALQSEQDEGLELNQLRAKTDAEALRARRETAELELAKISQEESRMLYETSEDDEEGFQCGGLTCARGSHCCHGSTTICCGPGGHCSHTIGSMSLCTLR
eukprot:TRINITY_DN3577_c0_g1_i1.p1 TRINITY_DN3577_c0_g1~~TRINITY_DN3577_c0_g1_i1.p1  ORF type:complete len:148 (+),score=28.67 TRINITY_DN3577_c0_g1_i1:66-446(+)